MMRQILDGGPTARQSQSVSRVWLRGKAAVCKTVYVGSNPAIRSKVAETGMLCAQRDLNP